MKKLILTILLLSFALSGCINANQEQQITGELLQGTFLAPHRMIWGVPSQDTMDFLLYLPESYYEKPDKIFPVILYLHGAGDDDNDSAFLMSHGIPEVINADELPDNAEFIVVAPQAFENKAWWDGDALQFTVAILDMINAQYRADRNRTYVTGVSLGGYGTWYAATEFPDRFAAAVSVSGSGYRLPEIPQARYMCKSRQVEMWGVHGDSDLISDPYVSELHVEHYNENCGGMKFTMMEGEGHISVPFLLYRDPAFYDWLLESSLDS